MTDKELLELAAKAAGIEVYESTDGTLQNRPVLVFTAGGGMGTMPYEERWNPLAYDAQALRLAVKLGLDVLRGSEMVVAETEKPKEVGCVELFSGDPYAATRRAIVRAAAEIGKAMK
jgi:hypothetical protein